MDSNIPNTAPAEKKPPVLKGRRARKTNQIQYWKGMTAFWMGIAIFMAGGIMSMTVGGSFAQIAVLLGLGFAIYGLTVESAVLLIRLIKER